MIFELSSGKCRRITSKAVLCKALSLLKCWNACLIFFFGSPEIFLIVQIRSSNKSSDERRKRSVNVLNVYLFIVIGRWFLLLLLLLLIQICWNLLKIDNKSLHFHSRTMENNIVLIFNRRCVAEISKFKTKTFGIPIFLFCLSHAVNKLHWKILI